MAGRPKGSKDSKPRKKKFKPLPRFLRAPQANDEEDDYEETSSDAKVMTRQTVTGSCNACRRKSSATVTSFSDRTVLIRCDNCGARNRFEIDESTNVDPRFHKPSPFDEDNE